MTASRKPGILIVGTGGHARVVVSALHSLNQFCIRGILDVRKADLHETILGCPVIGTSDDAAKWFKQKIRYAAVAIGDNRERSRLHSKLLSMGYHLPPLRHKTAILDPSVKLSPGTLIASGAILGPAVRIDEGVIVNTGSIIDHESHLGAFVHVAPGCSVAGRVHIGQESFIGIGSSLRDQITIGRRVTIGAGAVVISDIPDGATAYGVPARVRDRR